MEKYIFRAGAGKAAIELPVEFFPQENFSGIHDDIHVRAVILESSKRIVIISLELTSLPAPEIQLLKLLISSLAEASQDDIWICTTHSFSSPHFLPEKMLKNEEERHKIELYRKAIHEAVHKAVEAAMQHRKEAQIGIGDGECNVNVNRDILTNKGWWIGSNPEGLSDKTLTVIRIDEKEQAPADNPIAILYHYNVQSSIMDGVIMENGAKEITSDLVGKASNYIETAFEGNTVAMFLIGAAGDQAPAKKAINIELDAVGNLQERELKEQGYVYVKELGEELGQETVNIAKKVKVEASTKIMTGKIEFVCPGQRIPADIHSIQPTSSYEYIAEEDRNVSVEAIRIGEIMLLGTQPELNIRTAIEIKSASFTPKTIIMTMVNGASKYMADMESYDNMTYESMNSLYGKGAAEILKENAIELLKYMSNLY